MQAATVTVVRQADGMFEIKAVTKGGAEQSITLAPVEIASLSYALRVYELKWVKAVAVTVEAVQP